MSEPSTDIDVDEPENHRNDTGFRGTETVAGIEDALAGLEDDE